ncbi:hypothetical protein QE197_03115 [Arsenophonus nasoniae]|uniref:Uncharacterized protein n=1 Tax=Arsenophonus nasoniae TaxID=638 RepID=A0A4P7KRR0_9GAMM|nr:hypothetical protein [Arsenophonus nasoniae]QBY42286.1 hypothetical protein ArsFIN_08310 [Arsenophonus nasoniae]WGM11368.1 hypothetical protein QE197_03115 [Arsenophonus nasoniae]
MMNNHPHPDNPPGMMLFFLLMLLLGGAFDADAARPPQAALPYCNGQQIL